MKDVIDITMTAVLRPDLINITLKSFCDNLFTDRDRYRLVINIDPVGRKINPNEVIKVCMSYFENVKFNIAEFASFPRAVKWVWSNSTSEYVFHLEDDWIIYRNVNIDELINLLKKYPEMASLRLCRHKLKVGKDGEIHGCIYKYNKDGFFLTTGSVTAFGLNPTIVRGEYVREAAKLMHDELNPEKQFRYHKGNPLNDLIIKWKYAIYGRYGESALIYGKNGKKWLAKYGFKKPHAKFVTYSRYDGVPDGMFEKFINHQRTCSITNLHNKSVTFVRGPEYLKYLENTKKNLWVIIPKNLITEVEKVKKTSPKMKFYPVDNPDFAFAIFNNAINQFLPVKKNSIGMNCKIHPSVILDAEGLRVVVHPDGRKIQFLHTGNIIIGGDVEIGPNSMIRRGTIDSTIIKNGVKMGSVVNIGHNCIIGENTVMAGLNFICGSTVIGKNCWLGTGVLVRNGLSICDKVIIGIGSVVVKDIIESGIYFGNPAKYQKPYKEDFNF